MFVFLLAFASADVVHKNSEVLDLKVTCVYPQYCSNLSICNINVFYPNSSLIITGQNMTYHYSFHNYTLGLLENGVYPVSGFCEDGDYSRPIDFDIIVNPTGTILSDYQMYLIIFIFFVIFLILCFSVYGMIHATKGEWQILYICIFYLLLFSLVFLFWLTSKNYLYDVPLLESVFWITWLTLSILFFPFIIIVSSYILLKEAETLGVNDLMQEGYTQKEAKELYKKNKK